MYQLKEVGQLPTKFTYHRPKEHNPIISVFSVPSVVKNPLAAIDV